MPEDDGGTAGRVFVFGAGGHAKVIVEILEAEGRRIGGVFDQNLAAGPVWHYQVASFPAGFDNSVDELVIAVGHNPVRRDLAKSLDVTTFGRAIHPSAIISSRAQIGVGTVVMAGVKINADARIGDHCIVNTGASIDHDCVIGDFAHISPGVTLCGTVEVGEGTHVGAGAVAIPGRRVGAWTTVGAGAVVVRDVPDDVTVVGCPAQILRKSR